MAYVQVDIPLQLVEGESNGEAEMTTEVSLAYVDSKLADAHVWFQKTNFFGSLNGVRPLSFPLVLRSHANWLTGVRILDKGFLGVEVFFAISEFLIVGLLIGDRERTGTIDLGKSYIRGSLLILPNCYAVILLVLAASFVRNM
jgi:peptidoglycan/LPS O-acetylase OafA/YrhL